MTVKSRKRSGSITLTSLMAAGAAVSITACDTGVPSSAAQWGDAPAATSEKIDAQTFTSLTDCAASGAYTAEQCDTAYKQAQLASAENAPKFGDQASCEERYGVDQCVPRSGQGGNWFSPFVTGFIISNALNNMGGGYRGAPMYRDRDDQYYSGSGGRIQRDYLTGKARVPADAYEAPARVQSRSAVVSRRGFGGGGRSYGG